MAFRQEDPETLKTRVESLRAELEDAQQTIAQLSSGAPTSTVADTSESATSLRALDHEVPRSLSVQAMTSIEERLRAIAARQRTMKNEPALVTRQDDLVRLDARTWSLVVRQTSKGAHTRLENRQPRSWGTLLMWCLVPAFILAGLWLRAPAFLVGLFVVFVGAIVGVHSWESRGQQEAIAQRRNAFAAVCRLMDEDVRRAERAARSATKEAEQARVEDADPEEDVYAEADDKPVEHLEEA